MWVFQNSLYREENFNALLLLTVSEKSQFTLVKRVYICLSFVFVHFSGAVLNLVVAGAWYCVAVVNRNLKT